jgi:trehalose/maltose hydrolase-like predicted phosphorylase
MIAHPAFPAEPWSVRETRLDLDLLGQTESVFALANGHIGRCPTPSPATDTPSRARRS